MSMNVSQLPDELLIKIFSLCGTSAQASISQVCKRWNVLSWTTDVWQTLAEREFGWIATEEIDFRAFCRSEALNWQPVPAIHLPVQLGLSQRCYSRPDAEPPQFICNGFGGLSLYNARTFERISHLEGGSDPIGWYGEEFFCYEDKNAIAWNLETGAVRPLHLDIFGPSDQILHVGLWKGRPSLFCGFLREGEINAGKPYFGVCSLDGKQVETLCSFDWAGTTSPQPVVTSSADEGYLACSLGGQTYCFDTSSGSYWRCVRYRWVSFTHDFAFIGQGEHCLLIFNDCAPEAYSAASGQSVELPLSFPEAVTGLPRAQHAADWDVDRRLCTRFGWHMRSITTSSGTFLVAYQLRRYDLRSSIGIHWSLRTEWEIAVQGLFAGPNHRAPVALNPLTIVEAEEELSGWDLVPSGRSCRLVATMPGVSYTDYELSKTAREILIPETRPFSDDGPSEDGSDPMENSSSLLRSTFSQGAERSSSYSVGISRTNEGSGSARHHRTVALLVSLAAIATFGVVLTRRARS